MIKFYRTLHPYKVISFDLDDTLYDNAEVIRLAEQHCVDFLRHASQIEQLDLHYWHHWKMQVKQQDPILYEDVTAWRIASIKALLQFHHKNTQEIEQICQETITSFLLWRHNINVPPQNIKILNLLKSHYKLAALTNGNVVPERIGLSHFELTICGGKNGRAKPHNDLFHQAADYFKVKPQEILHVGDHLTSDIQGAMQAGCQSVWINLSGKTLNHFSEATLLPTLEINELSQLIKLI